MSRDIKPFDQPVYVTRPMFPEFSDYTEKLREIWDAQWLSNGGMQHQKLEAALSEFLRSQHLSLFTNGTIALIVACQALRLSGEVIVTPFTFPATPHVLSWNNISPVFADIDPVTMNLDPNGIERLITNKTSAILAVHVYGTPCDVHAIQRIADVHGLRVIYDAAHAFGSEVDGAPIASFGDATMFSFHATKLFHTAEGGALVVQNEEVKKRVDLLKNFGIKSEFEVIMPGINGKMNEIQAAMGLTVLKMVDDEREKRREIARIYNNHLSEIEGIDLPISVNLHSSSMQYYTIRVSKDRCRRDRDYVYEKLREYNVYSRKYFFPLCSDYSCYRMLPSASAENLPVAHKAAQEVLCLPFYSSLGVDKAEIICNMIKKIVAE